MILPGENKTNRFGTIPKNELNNQLESFTPVEIWDFSDSKFYDSFSKDIFSNNKNNRILIPELRMKAILQSVGLWLSIYVLNLMFTFLIIGIIVVFGMNQIDLLGLSMGLIYYLMTFLILLIFLSFDKERNYFWKLFSLQRPFYSFILMFLILILDFLLIFVVYDFLYELLMPSLIEEDFFYDSSSSNDPLILLLLFISLSIAAPIFEEIVFRGYILQKLRKSFSDIFSILLSGILFGIAHWSIFAPFDLYQTGAATIGGFLYAWLTIRTESLWPSIIAHSLWNGGIFLLMLMYVF
jgi:membrane protease YdiL (CAAX protease family)